MSRPGKRLPHQRDGARRNGFSSSLLLRSLGLMGTMRVRVPGPAHALLRRKDVIAPLLFPVLQCTLLLADVCMLFRRLDHVDG